ncbi:MAG: OmpA family protein, partial [Bacteroidetes bacterium]|nr:OmpA family protein [Bacteroidota bacterium]
DLVSIGWREGRWYVGARITEVADMRFRFSKDLMKLAINGNGPYLGELMQLGNIYLRASHYRKYAVNFSRDIQCKLRLGISAAFLYGMENLNVKRSEITLITNPVTFDLTGTSDILINSSGTESFNTDSLKTWPYQMQRKNRGVSVDIGATYKLNDKVDLSASLLDLGYIRWKYKAKSYSNKVSEFSFSGIPINDFLNANPDSVEHGINRYLDSLGNVFSVEESNIEKYAVALPARIYLSGSYALNDWNTLRFTYFGNTFHRLYSSAAISYTRNFNNLLEVSFAWALHNNTAANLGAGVTLNLGLTQFNLFADNLPAVFGAYNSRGTTVRAGITLVSGYGEDRPDYCDRDHDGIPNERDECPDDPGIMEMMGCPDSDLDGIPDKHDECPDLAGLLSLHGCPDTDGDGITDNRDACPELAGPPELDGCPDSDGDGITDNSDACPHQAGPADLRGCPDRDRDGIPDGDDACPDLPGTVKYNGCPDSDGDGIPDNTDECPQTAGAVQFNGCPDTDGDGISDQHDRCPELFGEKSNRGCPSGDTDNDGVPDALDHCPTLPGPKALNGCPELQPEAKNVVETAVRDLEFNSGKAVISGNSYEALDNLILLLRANPDWQMRISGHTDNSGTEDGNLRLSRDRARAVATYLIDGGISADRLKVEWFGQTKPIADNGTEKGRKKNRRVELKLIQ